MDVMSIFEFQMMYNSIITNTRFTFQLLRQTKGVPNGHTLNHYQPLKRLHILTIQCIAQIENIILQAVVIFADGFEVQFAFDATTDGVQTMYVGVVIQYSNAFGGEAQSHKSAVR